MADNVIKIVQDIAVATEGVSGIAFPGVLPIPKDNALNLEVYLNVDYGVSIPEVCWNVQDNISKQLTNVWGLKLGKINIHIENIEFKKQENK